jgi:hypothetical protein
MTFAYDYCASVERQGSSVVAKTTPGRDNRCAARVGCSLRIRVLLQECGPAVENSRHLGLLQHEFGHENRPWVSGVSPWQVSSVLAHPGPGQDNPFAAQRVRQGISAKVGHVFRHVVGPVFWHVFRHVAGQSVGRRGWRGVRPGVDVSRHVLSRFGAGRHSKTLPPTVFGYRLQS